MITKSDLKKLARARLKDSEVLFQQRRYDGAFYLCGYALEIALKARICRTLKWSGYTHTRREFESLNSFKTHDLEILLQLSGIENKIRTNFPTQWAIMVTWNPEIRYSVVGSADPSDATDIINATKILLRVI